MGADGERITRGTLQYRVLRAFRRAGTDAERARGALVHGLRHTFATELANADVTVYTLMKLLGHESMVTSQRYVTAAGNEHERPQPKTSCTTSITAERFISYCRALAAGYGLNPLLSQGVARSGREFDLRDQIVAGQRRAEA